MRALPGRGLGAAGELQRTKKKPPKNTWNGQSSETWLQKKMANSARAWHRGKRSRKWGPAPCYGRAYTKSEPRLGVPSSGQPHGHVPLGGLCPRRGVCVASPLPAARTDRRTDGRTEGPAVQEGRNKASRTGPGQLQSPTEMPPAPDLVASIHCGDADGRTAFLLLLLVLLPQRRAGGALRRGRTPAGPAPCSARRPASGPSSWW